MRIFFMEICCLASLDRAEQPARPALSLLGLLFKPSRSVQSESAVAAALCRRTPKHLALRKSRSQAFRFGGGRRLISARRSFVACQRFGDGPQQFLRIIRLLKKSDRADFPGCLPQLLLLAGSDEY